MYQILVNGFEISRRRLTAEQIRKYNNTEGVTVKKIPVKEKKA